MRAIVPDGRPLDDLWTFLGHNRINADREPACMPAEPTPADRPPVYRSYLLRFWEERGETPAQPVWRFSLEDPQTAHRQGFASLAALTDWLQGELAGLADAR
jgi:hypothetical protein